MSMGSDDIAWGHGAKRGHRTIQGRPGWRWRPAGRVGAIGDTALRRTLAGESLGTAALVTRFKGGSGRAGWVGGGVGPGYGRKATESVARSDS